MYTYHTYIFDLDGTLLDTLGDLAASTNYALRRHSMPERSLDEVRRFVGNGVQKLIERAVPEGTPADATAQVLDTFRQHYLLHSLDATRPYDGIVDMLASLSPTYTASEGDDCCADNEDRCADNEDCCTDDDGFG